MSVDGIVLEVLVLSVFGSAWLISILVRGYLKGYLPEKGKMLATTENFDELYNQLKQNTKTVEKIKADYGKQSWVHEQSWLKKQEAYEFIILSMLNLKKTIDYRLRKVESFIDANITSFCSHSGYEAEAHEQFERDREELWQLHASKFAEKSIVDKEKIREKLCLDSLEKTVDMIQVKSIYLDERVHEVADFIRDKIDSFEEPSMTEEYDVETFTEELALRYQELTVEIDNKFRQIVQLSRKELNLGTHEVD